jgi:hypothetical protein
LVTSFPLSPLSSTRESTYIYILLVSVPALERSHGDAVKERNNVIKSYCLWKYTSRCMHGGRAAAPSCTCKESHLFVLCYQLCMERNCILIRCCLKFGEAHVKEKLERVLLKKSLHHVLFSREKKENK